MVSLAEIVKGSERVVLPNNLTLLVPEGKKRRYIVKQMARWNESTNPFKDLSRGKVLDVLVSQSDRISLHKLTLYIVAPGKWDGEQSYYAIALGDGTSIMAPLATCGYDRLNARLMRLHST